MRRSVWGGWCWSRVALCLCCLALMSMAVGCGDKVVMKEPPKSNVSESDKEKIRGYLDAAGIKGEIFSFADNDTEWVVEVGAPAPAPGKRAAPTMPVPYQVNKATGKVTGG